ncbi:MAG: hypothetical protein ACRDY7_03400, partial [Acidimicrobiia bacterium]
MPTGILAVLALAVVGSQTGLVSGEATSPDAERRRAELSLRAVSSAPAAVVPLTVTPVQSLPPETLVVAPVPDPAAPSAAVTAKPATGEKAIVAPASFPARVQRAAATAQQVISESAGLPKRGGVWAVVVGIDDYPGESADLSAGTADAKDVSRALAAYGVPADRRM